MSRRIYVASRWRNAYQPAVVTALRDADHEVYDFRNPPSGTGFSWAQIDPDWERWTTGQYVAALQHPVAQAGFLSDFAGMRWADTCVLVLPCGRSANAEAGWCSGSGREVFVLQPEHCEPELMYAMYQGIVGSTDALLARLELPCRS